MGEDVPMAQRTVVKTHSDLSGEPDAVTVRFAFENARWEIDLTPAEREAFVRAIAPYTEKARRAPASRPVTQPPRSIAL